MFNCPINVYVFLSSLYNFCSILLDLVLKHFLSLSFTTNPIMESPSTNKLMQLALALILEEDRSLARSRRRSCMMHDWL